MELDAGSTPKGTSKSTLPSVSPSSHDRDLGPSSNHSVPTDLGPTRSLEGLSESSTTEKDRPFCGVFVLEQTLGHITHSKNLQAMLPAHDGVKSVFVPVDDSLQGLPRLVPGWSNWTVRAGVRARRALRRTTKTLAREHPPIRPDAMFVHSQVPAVLLGRWMERIPTVVSLDATPLQYDSLGDFYAHSVSSDRVEQFKYWLNRRCYRRAHGLVAWSKWAKQGLVDHYGVPPEKIAVIAPGVDVGAWSADREPALANRPVRILFVGGDLRRKGGELLIEAWRRLRAAPDLSSVELHLVTSAEVEPEPGLFVHRGLTANSPELIEQYRRADIFCLPTFGDCLPMVLAEAGAAGLPLVSTNVGAISELVRDGETGRLIPPGDLEALDKALRELIRAPDKRLTYGRQARALIEQDHDAGKNASQILSVLRDAASSSARKS